MSYRPIESYGIIGDLRTAALVGSDGSVDFMCWPEYDSPSVFCALLDDARGGRFRIHPTHKPRRYKQMYLPDTNVLLTRFLSDDGVAEILDFMPLGQESPRLMRQVRVVRGEMTFEVECRPRFDYARAPHTVTVEGRGSVVFAPRADLPGLRLLASVPLEAHDGDVDARITLSAGDAVDFVLQDAALEVPDDACRFCQALLAETIRRWRRWVDRGTYSGRWRDQVYRSALVLKLMCSVRYGSLVAAPTFGLPETLGGRRNWDYRFVWIRDAAFTVYTFIRLGFYEEAEAFIGWLTRSALENMRDSPLGPLRILYRLDGSVEGDEESLGHLEGYRGSAPVRIGNAAAGQLQLDIYGEAMDAIYLYDRYRRPVDHHLWVQLRELTDWVAENWSRPDHGLWEVRIGQRGFLHSRLMCWVAIDRALRIAQARSRPAPVARWRHTRDAIYRCIHTDHWNAKRGAFVQHPGTLEVDASSLMMPMVQFIGFHDPRWKSHLAVVERELVTDSLVFRYRADLTSDGLDGIEGTFSMCTFWYVENLARTGRLSDARFYLEKMLGYANHLGLYSEELGPAGDHLGNFPQAFTHLGLISAALAVDHQLNQPRRRPIPVARDPY